MNPLLAFGIPNGMEMVLLFLVILLLFGSKKLPELARGLGKSMQEFRKAREDFESEINTAKTELTVSEPANRQLHQNTSPVATAAINQNDELQRQVRELQDQLRAMQTTTSAPQPVAAPAPAPAGAAGGEMAVAPAPHGLAAMQVDLVPVEPGVTIPAAPTGAVPVGKLG